jgi:hypothetical protein
MNKTWWIILIVIVLAIGGYIWYHKTHPAGPGPLDEFAKCLTQKGAQFYGAAWCPHCRNQKKMFGSSAQYLPYIECSPTPNSPESAECVSKGVDGYPTWFFADGSKLGGEVALATLAQKTGCTLP